MTSAHALCVYAEPIVAGRRVVVVGDASLGLGARLADLGARIVHVYDADPERVQAANRTPPHRGVTVRELPQGEFDVRDGAFDVGVVSDLGAFADAASLIARLRRLLGRDGVVLASAKNAESSGGVAAETGALDYYELYDLLSMQFETVQMVGQVPFVGVTLAEIGESDDAPQVSVDTQLVVSPDPPEAFVAIGCAGHAGVRTRSGVGLPPYVIVQLPRVAATATLSPPRAETGRTEVDAAVAERDERLRALESRAGDSHVRAERLTHEIKRLEEELERQRERNFRLTRDVEEERKTRQKAELELGLVRRSSELPTSRDRIVALEEALRVAEETNREWQVRAAGLAQAHSRQVSDLEAELGDREEAMRGLEAELARAIDAHPKEIARYEEALRERAQAIQLLEQEVTRREQIVRELVADAEDAREHDVSDVAVAVSAREADQALELAGRTQALYEAEEALGARTHELREAREEASASAVRAAAQLAEMHGRLDVLAQEVARREAELHASAWRIAELEQRSSMLDARVSAVTSESATTRKALEAVREKLAGEESRRARCEDELDVLRKALAQEHADRARAESGDALARARAEIERQAELVEHLSRELDARDRAAVEHSVEP